MYKYKDEFINDFIARTKVLLERNSDTEYDVTLFINCLLGLLIIPKERNKKVIDDSLFSSDLIRRITECISKDTYSDHNMSQIIRHVRNSFVHGNFEPKEKEESEPKVVGSLVIKDSYIKKGFIFEMECPIELFKEFVIECANVFQTIV